MNARWLVSCGWMLFAGSALVGCSGAEWRTVQIDSPYTAPKSLTVTVVAPPAAKEAAEALSSALVDELRSGGIAATVVPAVSGAAEANLSINKWDPGSRGLRWLAFGSGQGECIVSVDTATIGVEGTVHGWVKGGFFGGDADNAASAAGHLIGKAIVTGRSQPTPSSD